MNNNPVNFVDSVGLTTYEKVGLTIEHFIAWATSPLNSLGESIIADFQTHGGVYTPKELKKKWVWNGKDMIILEKYQVLASLWDNDGRFFRSFGLGKKNA